MSKIQGTDSFLLVGVFSVLGFGVGCSNDTRPVGEEELIPTELIVRIQSAGAFDSDLVEKLEELRQEFSDPKERAVVDLLIVSQNNLPRAQMAPEEVRRRLEEIADAYPGTWMSAAARVGIAVNFGSFDPYEERVNAWLDALDDPGLPEFRDGNDPLLRPLVQSNASENAKDIEDIILNQLVYHYTTGFDLESAKDARDRIQSEGWRDRASSHVERPRELDPDDLAERRRWFLERLEEAEAR